MFELRSYQIEIAQKACEKLKTLGLVYIAAQVRCGKTHMSLEAARLYGAKNVLFVTKKKAIKSIEGDFKDGGYKFNIEIINSESIHKAEMKNPDIVILDEAHQYAALPKPSNRTKEIKQRYGKLPLIFLSGTPTPENWSQIFHQLWISARSPFSKYVNFYKWAQDYVKVYQVNMGYATVNQYDRARQELIRPIVEPYFLTFTQQEAGFQSQVVEHFLYVDMLPKTYNMIELLKNDFFIEGKNGITITAGSAVALMSKIHQLGSGTIKADNEIGYTIDTTKADFIKETFKGVKIGIFYKFKEEYEMLKKVFGDQICNTLDEFNGTDKNIALQIVAGREGISLKEAKYLVYLCPDFSATSYEQSKARTQTKDRLETEVFWIFSKDTIDEDVYKKVKSKGKYTSSYYLKSHGINFPKQANQTI
jgi:hypothetical protein